MVRASLFHIKTETDAETSALTFAHQAKEPTDHALQFSGRAKFLLDSIKDDLKENTHVDFVTAGELSIHHFINYFCHLLSGCTVYISSWAIKEDPARLLLSLKQSGKIKKLYGVFDYRIKTLDAKHFHLIESSFSKYVLTKNHSKIVVIESKALSLVIVSSANLSNNPRIESGFISTVPKTVDFHKGWMNEVLNGKTVY